MAYHEHDTTPRDGPDDRGLWPGEYRFCPHCGTKLGAAEHAGVPRMRCEECGFIHYRNPGVGAAVVIFDDRSRLLLVKRGPEATQSGKWSIPAGFVDYGEEIRAAAARELLEETGLIATVGEAVFVASNFHDAAKLTVGIWFAGTVTGGSLKAGDDADEAAFFPLDALPDLAFDTDRSYLESMGVQTP